MLVHAHNGRAGQIEELPPVLLSVAVEAEKVKATKEKAMSVGDDKASSYRTPSMVWVQLHTPSVGEFRGAQHCCC